MGGLVVKAVLNYLEKHPEVIDHLVGVAIASLIAHLMGPAPSAPAKDLPAFEPIS